MNQEIQNYLHRLRTDFPFYCRTVIRVKNKAGQLVPYELNKMQLHLWSIVKHYIANNLTLWMFLIKLRQGGATTFFTVLMFWLTTLWPHRNALGIAHDEDAAKGVGGKFQFYYQTCDPNFRPKYRIMNRKEIYFATDLAEFDKTGDIGLDCHIDTFTIDKKEIGRSYTYQYALLTEYARYNEVISADTIEERLLGVYNAVPKIPGVFTLIVKESTAAGDNYAKEDWEDENSGFMNVFISWIASEEYRLEVSPTEYFELSQLEDSRYGDEVEERKKIIKQLAFWWPELTSPVEIEHEVYCRLAWRRDTINTKCKGKKFKFRQEYPTAVEDAFAYSGESIFPLEALLKMSQFIDKMNYPSTNYSYYHDDKVEDETRKFYQDDYGHLTIYEHPIPGATYVIGADGAQGIKPPPNKPQDRDESTAIVFKLPEMVEVAMFADIIIPDQFAGVCNNLAKLYNNALLGVEINDKGGYATVEKLVNFYHYSNLYFAVDPLNQGNMGNIRWGWITSPTTRQIMIDDFTVNLETGQILIKSKKLLKQCETFIMIKNKPQSAPGKHDDLVIAAMIARQMASAAHIKQPEKPIEKAPFGSCEWHLQRMGVIQGYREKFSRRTMI